MSRACLSLLLVTPLLLAPAALAEEERPLVPEDFRHGRTLLLTADTPLQTLLLDLPVYRGSVTRSLADLRVMNGAGEVVPHAVRQLTHSSRQARDDVDLPLFALRDAERIQPEDARVELDAAGARAYRIRAEVTDDGALVEVESTPPGAPEAGEPPPAYLLDTSQLGAAVTRLDFDLAPGESGFVVPVRVEGSSDLIHFRPVRERSALVRLEQDGHQIDKSHLTLPGTRHRYLRVSWPAAPLPVPVRGVRARLAPKVAAPPRERTRVSGRPVPDATGVYRFDLGGALPVDRAQVLLPQTNTLIQARLRAASRADGPWRLQFEGLLYDLQYGETLRNPELTLTAGRHRYLELEVAPGTGGISGGTPLLEVAWHPEQLLFIRRGQPPFRLVYGRADAPAARFTTRQLLKAWPGSTTSLPRASAVMGEEFALGDPSVLEPPVPPPPYRTWALWSVLLLAVGAVLGMSTSLLRQMRSRGA